MNVWKRTVAAIAIFVGSAGVAYAGTAVTGSGDSPSAAMNDANARAAEVSRKRWGRGTCITPASYESCRKDQYGYWICTAYVNNEQGSSC